MGTTVPSFAIARNCRRKTKETGSGPKACPNSIPEKPSILTTVSQTLAKQTVAIYLNASILTMADAPLSYVEALAVRDTRIAFAGDKEAAMRLKSDAATLIDLGGKALLPRIS